MKTRPLSHAITLLACALCLLAPHAQAYNVGTTNISGARSTPQYGTTNLMDNGGNPGPFGPYGWNYSYTRSFNGTNVTKDVEINFIFAATLGYTDAQKAAYRASAQANIEGIWNNKFIIRDTANNMTFPLNVNVTTNGPFNQTVNVTNFTGNPVIDREDMVSWNNASTAATMAHEFGHMLGLFDEYIGGAVDQYPSPTLSNDGLMGLGALNANPVMYPRYYQQYLDYMNQLNPGGSFVLEVVPEPSTVSILMVCGIAAVFLRVRFRRSELRLVPAARASPKC